MREFFERIRAQAATAWSALQPSQKIWIGLLSVGTLAALFGIFFFVTRTEFAEIGRYDTETAAEIKKTFTDEGMVEGTDFRIAIVGDKAVVEVDAKKRSESSLLLAGKGLVGTREKGFTIFEGFDLTTTDLEQKIKEIEGLKSELRRMIRAYRQVEDVQISFPRVEQSLFIDNEIEQTAGVVLTLRPGEKLADEQVKAVRNLIAFSFPGLKPENISMADQNARPLIPEESGEGAIQAKQRGIELQTAQEMERNIRKVLGPVVGDDKFTVAVTLEFNWDALKDISTVFSSPGFEPIRESQQKTEESLRGEGIRPGGEPGTASNVPPAYNATGRIGPVDYKRTEEVVNFLANKSVIERTQAPFVKRLTAAVAIDGIWASRTDTEGKVERVYQARDAQVIQDIRSLVQSALGENADRRDNIVVKEIPWDRERQFAYEDKLKEAQSFERKMMYGLILAIPATAMVFFGYLIWNQKRKLREQELARGRELDRQRTLAQAEAGIAGEITLEEQERMEIQRRAQSIARTKPGIVADLIRTWMSEDEAA